MCAARPARVPEVHDLETSETSDLAAWAVLADVLLQAHAVACRTRSGTPPDALAGLRILDDEAARLIDELLEPRLQPLPVPVAASEIEQVRAWFASSLEWDLPFSRLVAAAGLTIEEAEVLALCVAVEVEPVRQRIVAYLNDDVTKSRPTLQLLTGLFGRGHVGPAAVAADARLRRAALVAEEGEGPWSDRVVAVAPAVAWFLLGDRSAEPDLPSLTELIEGIEPQGAGHRERVIVVVGDDRTRRLEAALREVDAEAVLVTRVPADGRAWEAVIRQATLRRTGVVLEVDGALPPEARWWLERADHLKWCVASATDPGMDALPRRPWRAVRAAEPLAEPVEVAMVTPEALGRGHRFTADQLSQLERLLPAMDGDLDAAIRALGGGALDRLARRIRPQQSLADLVLGEDQLAQVVELVARYRHRDVVLERFGAASQRAAGLIALFSGPSGTGKTMAAEVVAGELGLDLYLIDLASVVSKYIGETEQNLDRVFDAAAAGNAVLLFDEADSLFGARTQVSDSRDRYANIEVSYLLQRLERFDGLAVLTTNLRRNIDEAFLRRIHVGIDFPMPDPSARTRLWERYLSAAVAGEDHDVDVSFLAERFELTGGSVRNVAITAAFLATEAGTALDMPSVVLALRRELQKQGRMCTESDFGPWFSLVQT